MLVVLASSEEHAKGEHAQEKKGGALQQYHMKVKCIAFLYYQETKYLPSCSTADIRGRWCKRKGGVHESPLQQHWMCLVYGQEILLERSVLIWPPFFPLSHSLSLAVTYCKPNDMEGEREEWSICITGQKLHRQQKWHSVVDEWRCHNEAEKWGTYLWLERMTWA